MTRCIIVIDGEAEYVLIRENVATADVR